MEMSKDLRKYVDYLALKVLTDGYDVTYFKGLLGGLLVSGAMNLYVHDLVRECYQCDDNEMMFTKEYSEELHHYEFE